MLSFLPIFLPIFLLACAGRTPEAIAPLVVNPKSLFSQRFTTTDGVSVPVPGARTLVVELIRSADW